MNDFALIDVNCELGSPAELSRSTPNYGSSIVVVGNPLNLYDNVFVPMEGLYVGKVSARRVMNTHLITAPIVEGYSGAGVWQEGKLVGIANMVNTIKGYRNLSYMIPIDVIRADLRMYELSLGKIDGG